MSYGQHLTSEYLKLLLDEPFYQNFRPEWLNGLELDFYYPSLHLAVEFQGDQHFIHTIAFGRCNDQRRRDRAKRDICVERGVALLRLKAFDLQYGRMRMHLKRCLRQLGLRGYVQEPEKWRWKELSAKCVAYRKQLVKRYDSPSAGCGERRRAARARKREEYKLFTKAEVYEF